MKKFLISIVLIFALIVSTLSIALFTPFGNRAIADFAQTKLNEDGVAKFDIEKFALTIDSIELNFLVDDNSKVQIDGEFDIFSQTLALNYNIDVEDLSKFQKIIGRVLNGSLVTTGVVKGNREALVIKGSSDIADSYSEYFIDLKNFKDISKVVIASKNLKVDKLLYMLNEPVYARANLNLYAKLTDLDVKNLDGKVALKLSDGVLNSEAILKNFNIELPYTDFRVDLNSDIEDSVTDSKVDLDSNLIDLKSSGVFNINSQFLNIAYSLKIDELAKLKNLTKEQFNGELRVDGIAKGDRELLDISGDSGIAKSKAKYSLNLKNFKDVSNLELNIDKMKLEEILHLVNQPLYAKGNLSLKADIKSLNLKALDGAVITKIDSGILNENLLREKFNLTFPKTVVFNSNIYTNLESTRAISKVDFISTLFELHNNRAIFDLKDNSILSDYVLEIGDLSNFSNLLNQKIRGAITLNGDIEKSKKLKVTGYSKNLFDGDLNFTLLDTQLNANLENIEFVKLLWSMHYPEIFTSKADAKVKLDIEKLKGDINTTLLEGRFLKNDFTTIVETFTKRDLTKEVYRGATLDSQIDGSIVNSKLKMISQNSKIISNNTEFDIKQTLIDSTLTLDIKDRNMSLNIRGDIKSPKITVDTKGYLKEKLKKEVNKHLGEHIDKIDKEIERVIPKEIKDTIEKNLLEKLNNFF